MAIKYTIVKYHNPQGEKGKNYYRARVLKSGDYTTEQLAEEVNDCTGMSDTDAVAVLHIINKLMRKALLSGHTVVLDGIGRISVGMNSDSFTEEQLNREDFIPSAHVNSLHINFLAEKKLLKELRIKNTLNCVFKRKKRKK